MKRYVVLVAVLLLLAVGAVQAQEEAVPLKNGWSIDYTAGFNGMAKLVEGEPGSDAVAEVIPVVAVNGGLSFYWGPLGDEENKKLLAINFPLVIISPRDDAVTKWDMSLALTFGVFDNLIMLGVCYDFGVTEWDRSRFGGLFSFGVEF